MRILFLFSVAVLLITNMICFVGCSRDGQITERMLIPDFEEEGWVIEEMPINPNDFEILISESRPAQVTVNATSAPFHNTCVTLHEIHQTRVEDTIHIQITWRTGGGGFDCGQAFTAVPVQVLIGTFGVGEYSVIVNNSIGRVFRIE